MLAAVALGCGSQAEPIDSPPPGPSATATPPEAGVLGAPRNLRASVDEAAGVRLQWDAPEGGAIPTSYRVVRDGKPLATVDVTSNVYMDGTAAEPSLGAPLLRATDGTRESGVLLTWSPTDLVGKSVLATYAIVAVYGARESVPSPSAEGARSGKLTGYELSRDGGLTWRALPGLELAFEDVDAPRAKVDFPIPSVTADPTRSTVRVELTSLPTAGEIALTKYRVRGRAGAVGGAASVDVEGRRKVGRVDTMAIQWQRSAGDSDGSFSDLPSVTGRVWFDRDAPVNATRYFRARATSPWAEGVSEARPGRAIGWLAADAEGVGIAIRSTDRAAVFDFATVRYERPGPFASVTAGSNAWHCGVRTDGTIDCWNPYRVEVITPPAGVFTRVAVGDTHACAIRSSDGRVLCWGSNGFGEGPPGPSSDSYKALSARSYLTCGIRTVDSKVVCWGRSAPAGPSADAFKSIAVPYAGTGYIGIRADGAWVSSTSPPLFPSQRFDEVVNAGLCAIRTSDRHVICNLGEDSGAPASSAWRDCAISIPDGRIVCPHGGRRLPPDDSFQAVEGSGYRVRGLTFDGRALELGSDSYRPLSTTTRYRSISGSCGIRAADGMVECGDGSPARGPASRFIPGTSCYVRTSDDHVVCDPGFEGWPFAPLGADVAALAILYNSHTCIHSARDGLLRCYDSTTGAPSRSPGPAGIPLRDVWPESGPCGIGLTDGRIYCWNGATFSRGSGEGPYKNFRRDCVVRERDDRAECYAVYTPPLDAFHVAFGNSTYSACGLRISDGKVQCWGDEGAVPKP